METTYRLIVLENREITGQTAASQELAKLVPPNIDRTNIRFGMEMTEWTQHFEKMRVNRSILIDAETAPNEWAIG